MSVSSIRWHSHQLCVGSIVRIVYPYRRGGGTAVYYAVILTILDATYATVTGLVLDAPQYDQCAFVVHWDNRQCNVYIANAFVINCASIVHEYVGALDDAKAVRTAFDAYVREHSPRLLILEPYAQ